MHGGTYEQSLLRSSDNKNGEDEKLGDDDRQKKAKCIMI
jgi:hypothetical protein